LPTTKLRCRFDRGARGRVGGGLDDDVAHLRQHRAPGGADLLGEMILDPGRHERRWCGQAHLARIGIARGKPQRLQPAVEDALAAALAQARPDAVPGRLERKLARIQIARVNYLLHAHLSHCRKRPCSAPARLFQTQFDPRAHEPPCARLNSYQFGWPNRRITG
jgi:hypothetical protein